MSNIITATPAVRPAHQQPPQGQGNQLSAPAADDAPAEPQVTMSTPGAGEPLLAD